MRSYLVGGAVRDVLLGITPKDRDYVVVGSTPHELLEAGYQQVGMGFPVFLHPETGEEYALARRELKTGVGYGGFAFDISPDVALEEDLERRDLTINSMALMADGDVVDPYGGQTDLDNRILRHTSNAFSEDPLRVIRLARFFARYHKLGFRIAKETTELCVAVVDSLELDALHATRYWLELEKVFKEESVEPFFKFLHSIGALSKVSFFRRLLGENYDYARVVGAAQLINIFIDQDFKVDALAAFMTPADPEPRNWFHTVRAANAWESINLARKIKVVTAEAMHDLMVSTRAFSEFGEKFKDMVELVHMSQKLGDRLEVDQFMLRCLCSSARAVTAEKYLHLTGKEIGEAMRSERIARMVPILQK